MKKIMFNDRYGLTEAVLSGRKTQTRRIVPQKELDKACEFAITYFNETFDVFTDDKDVLQHYFFVEEIGKLPYRVGEVVAVAQCYKDCGYASDALDRSPKDLNVVRGTLRESKGWNNKMFVRSDACKHHIRITNVRVERLQDISDEDCIAEGIYKDDGKTHFNGYAFQIIRDQYGNMLSKQWYSTPREAYAALIDRISGKGTWQSNPYVLVDEFELIK